MSEEPSIVINGVSMTTAQVATIRTALEHFASSRLLIHHHHVGVIPINR